MIIGFDGKRAVSNLTGLGNYSRLIVEAVAREHPSDSLLLFAPRDSDNPRLAPLRALPNVSIHTPAPSEARLGGAFWRSFGLTKSLKSRGVQLFHGLSNELPLNIGKAGIPSVLTMHDVIYRTMPECYSLPDRKIYDLKYGASCRRATRIIAISECTRRDIMRFYGVPEERISVVYQGVDSIFHAAWTPVQIEEIRQNIPCPHSFCCRWAA